MSVVQLEDVKELIKTNANEVNFFQSNHIPQPLPLDYINALLLDCYCYFIFTPSVSRAVIKEIFFTQFFYAESNFQFKTFQNDQLKCTYHKTCRSVPL